MIISRSTSCPPRLRGLGLTAEQREVQTIITTYPAVARQWLALWNGWRAQDARLIALDAARTAPALWRQHAAALAAVTAAGDKLNALTTALHDPIRRALAENRIRISDLPDVLVPTPYQPAGNRLAGLGEVLTVIAVGVAAAIAAFAVGAGVALIVRAYRDTSPAAAHARGLIEQTAAQLRAFEEASEQARRQQAEQAAAAQRAYEESLKRATSEGRPLPPAPTVPAPPVLTPAALPLPSLAVGGVDASAWIVLALVAVGGVVLLVKRNER